MSERIIVTAALPYANGSLHIGHLVEYCQADIYVRALKRLGKNALYICADDTHGTPIEVNAQKLGIPPEEFVKGFHEEHTRDFAKFDVSFDHYSTTHSPTNQKIVEEVYQKLRDAGHLEDRESEEMWSEEDGRFLPDRFIKGTCPFCGTPDQYGDVCENCKKVYEPKDLIDPKSVLSGATPVLKKTTHTFFKISAKEHVEFLQKWLESGSLRDEQANYLRGWLEEGLQDWCITRDGPYFGFSVPDREGKFFYVWLDAPFGYIASSAEWGEKNGVSLDDLWRSENTRVEHIIGKDIIYFHTLFWPAVLRSVGYTLPSKVHVHGFLTVDGKKMSKSRGTFINASVFAEHIEPQALRYYYASKYTSSADDLDLSVEDFVNRINAELVNKHANLFSRAAQFLNSRLEGTLGDLPFSAAEARESPARAEGPDVPLVELARRIVQHCGRVEKLYADLEFGQALRELNAVADIGNEFMQSAEPWVQIKEDPEAARLTCTFALNVCHALATYLWPIVPRFSEAGARILNASIESMSVDALFGLRKNKIGEMERLFERVDKKSFDAVIEASKTDKGPQPNPKAPPLKDTITFDDFTKLDLRVGTVLSAEPIPKSSKLYKLSIDLGEGSARQVVGGLAKSYKPEDLIGTQVVVVANLAPAKLMGVESNGMVLAGSAGKKLAVVRLDESLDPGSAVS